MKRFKLTLTASAVLSTALLTGCVFNSEITKEAKEHEVQTIDSTKASMTLLKEELSESKGTPKERYWQREMPILNISTIPIVKPLPEIFDQEVDFVEPFDVSVNAFLIKASNVIGIKIKADDDVILELEEKAKSSKAQSSGGGLADSLDATGALSTSSLFTENTSGPKMSLSQSGTVKELMNSISSLFGGQWRYNQESNTIEIYKYITKNFYIPSIPGGYSLGSSVLGANAENKASFSINQSVWSSIREDIGTMVSSKGSFTLSETSGILTVRDTNVVISRVEDYIYQVKKGMRSQVLIDVKIFSIIQDSINRKDLNLAVAFAEAGITGTLKGATGSAITGASSLILGTETGVATADRTGLAGTQTFINLLEKYGTSSVVASNTIRTVNNQPSALTTSNTESFLQKKEVTIDSISGSTQTDLTIGEKTTGLSLHILPTLDENGKDILLQISFTLSKIKGYNTYDGGDGNQVTTPVITSRDFVEKVWLKSGQTLVLSGFDITESSKEGAGTLDKDFWGFGGSSQDIVKKEKLVIVITPVAYNAITSNRL